MGEAVDFYACVLGIDDASGSCLGACLGEGCLGEGVYVAVAVGDEGEGVGLCGVAELSVLPAYLVDYSHGVGELAYLALAVVVGEDAAVGAYEQAAVAEVVE